MVDLQEIKEFQKVELSEFRLKVFKVVFLDVFWEVYVQLIGMNCFIEFINWDSEEFFFLVEIQVVLSKMQDDNQVMVFEGIIFFI